MNKKGSYQIIDLKDFNFTKDSTEYNITKNLFLNEGKIFFESIFGKDKKPLLISNIVINGVEKNDVIIDNYDLTNNSNTEMHFKLYNYDCNIYHDDAICYMVINVI